MKKPKMLSKSVDSFPNYHHPSASAVIIGSSTDILREILICLPVKSLLVFKIVSKMWHSLISDPHFVCYHSLKTPPKTTGLFIEKSVSDPLIQKFEFISLEKPMNSSSPSKHLSFVNHARGIKIEHSCNGLLCCSSYRSINTKRIFYVYNPSTTRYISLPLCPSKVRDTYIRVCSVSLAFNPLKSPHYKAICILKTNTNTYSIEIYSSETASWKVFEYVNFRCEEIFSKSGVFWNGSLHWINLENYSLYKDPEQGFWMRLRESSMVLDIDQGAVKTFPIPSVRSRLREKTSIGYFGECKGHMYLIEICSHEPTQFDIVEMETDYSTWNVKYHVNLDPVLNNEILGKHYMFYLLLLDEDEGTSSSLVLRMSNNIISYNLKNNTFEKIHDLLLNYDSKGIIDIIWLDASQYIGTLAHV